MTKHVQLKLWVEDPEVVDVQCPLCGNRFNSRSQLPTGKEVKEKALAHPRIRTLTQSQRAFLRDMPVDFLGGDLRMGVTDFSAWANFTVNGAQYHIKKLVRLGVLLHEPKRPGGTYCVYRFAFPNGDKIHKFQ